MNRNRRIARGGLRAALLGGVASTLLATAAVAQERPISFDIAAQDAGSALNDFSRQSGMRVLFPYDAVEGKRVPAVRGDMTVDAALGALLKSTGLVVAANDGTTVTLTDPQSGSAVGGGAEVEALIVTAQKREEDIQDVPIAISAFSQEDLTRSQIAGGPDLITQVPNMTFTKTNFSSYSVQIRGIGTQAISATVDPAVAVAFNNTPFIRNRFFEQEFYDLQRVEVLRGPQGTLYGRNATAGVVNLLSARPKHQFEAKLSGDVSNFSSSRLEGMINLPLVEDRLAFRLAGAWTKRQGYVTNQMTGEQIDGRDLWSARATLGFEPTDTISAYLTYEHFEENDDRIRSGKQLCKKALSPTEIGGVPVPLPQGTGAFGAQSYISQGCEAASLYSDESFQTPNAHALPYYGALFDIGLPVNPRLDPYLSAIQSRDLRVIESSIEPRYQADTDILHLQVSIDLSDALTLTSETAFSHDSVFSTQDYNRFTTTPGAFDPDSFQADGMREGVLDENGVYCDPQLGCSDRLLAADLSTSDSQQYSQEVRLSSDFDGSFNFSLGVNFLRHDAMDKYYVFVNTLGMWSAKRFGDFDPPVYVPGVSDNRECIISPFGGNPDILYEVGTCIYMDPNPIGSLNDLGHNYFLSKNPYRLISYAAFGELYYNITPTLKLTGGLRWTVDKKHAPEIPSWLLAGESIGYPVSGVVEQEWREPTGRLTIDWKPVLTFTDETLLYASYAHGYKAGGANPPRPVLATYGGVGVTDEILDFFTTFPKTFEPEFIDAYEVGTKNTLFGARVTLNASAFYYDYKGYQISEILNRSAVNRNFDAEIWGAELELDWRPFDNLRIGLKQGWEQTRVGEGEQVIDLMDRTAGNPDYMVVKAFPTIPSNCIVPVSYVADRIQPNDIPGISGYCSTYLNGTAVAAGLGDVPNNGEGIFKDLSGNELPNAPEFTTTLTADYTVPLPREWLLNLHADYYRQSEAWWRIINADPYDRLKPYQTVNFAAIFTNEDAGWNVMAYVKNVFDETAITGAFLNSDDSGLTTNVFLTEPRLYGLRVTKRWSGAPLWDVAAGRGEPHPLTLELAASALQMDASNEVFRPNFVDTFTSPDLPFPMSPQEEDLDWGDGRDVKLTYRPTGSPWMVSAAYRFGRTNGAAGIEYHARSPGGQALTPELEPLFPQYSKYVPGVYEFTTSVVNDRERHEIVDFEVGRDLGIGMGDVRSSIAMGLRYAQLDSSTDVKLYASDYYLPVLGAAKYHTTAHMYEARLSVERSFEGLGPTLSWNGSRNIIGNDDTGLVDLDWSLSGSVLFGKQRTDMAGGYADNFYSAQVLFAFNQRGEPASVTETPIARSRSENVTVPGLGARLGLSYDVGRVKVGAGYSWERYFDAIDGGIDERKTQDRTIDGPYFRLSVGFGG